MNEFLDTYWAEARAAAEEREAALWALDHERACEDELRAERAERKRQEELDVIARHLATLAANLALAAVACEAFALGDQYGYASCPCDGPRDEEYYAYLDSKWSPGCGRAVHR